LFVGTSKDLVSFLRLFHLQTQEVNQFQNRLNRAMMQCQDEARDLVVGDIENDARQMRKFEAKLIGCMSKTVNDHIGLLSPMMQRVERALK